MVMADGFAWNGQTYDSLSKVAFAITGTKWNGPRFFGLRDKEDRPEAAPDDHVKAPPDLLDDDVVSKPISPSAASPAADKPIKKPVEPERDAYGNPKPVIRDRATIQAERERNLAQQKKTQGES
jgi:hypothetical protein